MRINQVALIIALTALSSTTLAGLIGSGVEANYHFVDFGDVIGSDTTTVTAGVEWTNPVPFPGDSPRVFESIDIANDYILFDFIASACCEWTDRNYNGFEFVFDLGTFDNLTAVSFSANNDDYIDTMLSWSGDTLFINWGGGNITNVDSVQVNLGFVDDKVSVPGPSSIALLVIGLLGLAVRRCKTC